MAIVAVGAAVAAGVVATHHGRPAEPVDTSFTVSGALGGVAATSSDNAWTVGCADTSCTKPVILRWNGTTWTRVPSPDLGTDYALSSVAAASADSAWAFGWTDPDASSGTSNGSGDRTLILRWNGTAWTRVPSPSPGPSARIDGVTALSSGDAWATGTVGGKTLVLWWNGQRWTGPAGPLPPTVSAPSAVPSAAASTVPPVTSSGAAPTPSAASSSAQPSRRQAAQALAALLAQGGTDRAAVTQAVSTVADCSPGLSQAEAVFSNAASSRQGPAGPARRPARPLGPARIDAAGPHHGLASLRPGRPGLRQLDAGRDLARMQHQLPVRCQLPGRKGAG